MTLQFWVSGFWASMSKNAEPNVHSSSKDPTLWEWQMNILEGQNYKELGFGLLIIYFSGICCWMACPDFSWVSCHFTIFKTPWKYFSTHCPEILYLSSLGANCNTKDSGLASSQKPDNGGGYGGWDPRSPWDFVTIPGKGIHLSFLPVHCLMICF